MSIRDRLVSRKELKKFVGVIIMEEVVFPMRSFEGNGARSLGFMFPHGDLFFRGPGSP